MENTVKVKKPMNKDSLIITIVIAVVVLLTVGIVAYYFWGMDNEVLITYKGGKITRGEYEAVYRYWAPQFAYYGYDTKDTVPQYIIDEMLLNEVLYEKATTEGYKISDEDKATIDENFSDTDSVAALRSKGINSDILKEFFYKNAVVSDYLEDYEEATTTEEVKASIIASEGEDADLNIYNIRYVLIKTTASYTEEEIKEAREKAESVLKKAKSGEDMAELAKEYSEDSSTASDGGALKMVNNSNFDESVRKAVLSLKEGKLYGSIVESDYGFFVIKLESIDKNGRLTYDNEIQTYVNEFIEKCIDEVFDVEEHAKEIEKTKNLANRLNKELGISYSEE